MSGMIGWVRARNDESRASAISDGEIDAASAASMWQTVTVASGLIIIGRRVGT
jgi:hypothetical protein